MCNDTFSHFCNSRRKLPTRQKRRLRVCARLHGEPNSTVGQPYRISGSLRKLTLCFKKPASGFIICDKPGTFPQNCRNSRSNNWQLYNIRTCSIYRIVIFIDHYRNYLINKNCLNVLNKAVCKYIHVLIFNNLFFFLFILRSICYILNANTVCF